MTRRRIDTQGGRVLIRVIYGNFLFTGERDHFTYRPGAYLVIEDGVILSLFDSLPERYKECELIDHRDCLIIPGFSDLHTHAPQFLNCGTGYDEELLPWLTKYTYPLESRFSDLEFASRAYTHFLRELWRGGTTRACLFGTMHQPASSLLFDLMSASGLGGYVGKVNMDRNSIPSLSETCEESLDATEAFIDNARSSDGLVKPILTPRFVPSTTEKLMTGLGILAEKYDLPIQSHVSENRDEVLWVKTLHPDIPSFSEIYDYYGLLRRRKTVLAHAVYLTEREKVLLKQKDVYIAHCPLSNTNMASGIMPLREYLERGMLIGLASDVSGGHRLDMMSAVSGACEVSNLLFAGDNSQKRICLSEAFYLATKGSGSFFGKVGSFEDGYDADLLVLHNNEDDIGYRRTPEEVIGKFIYAADHPMIKHRMVRGKEVFCPF